MPATELRTQSGQRVVLGPQLGKGGEGTVFQVRGSSNLAAKIYHPDKVGERREKIEAIVNEQWHKSSIGVAFPIDALYTSANQFVGFTMPLVTGNKPIHELYSPTSRRTEFPKATFPFLIRTALNIAKALARVHSTSCVVGDVNHSGILIGDNALATLIDCDSFQVSVGNRIFLCKVGVPDFTPPELQGKRLDQIQRTPNHDLFGLAVVLFNLLFMGRHPYAGRYSQRGDMPLETAIAQFRFAYSARKNETQMEPPPHVPLLSDIPSELSDAFEIAFGQIGAKKTRPTAADWVDLLTRSERGLVRCARNASHHHFRTAPTCPWCRMEAAYPGFLAFAPPFSTRGSSKPINVGELIAAIGRVPNPGTAPELSSLMPIFAGPPSVRATSAKATWLRSFVGALAGAGASAVVFRLSELGPLLGLVGLCGSAYLGLRRPPEIANGQKLVSQLSASWRNVETQWNKVKEPHQFTEKRREAEELIRVFQNLGAEEARELTNLKARARDHQLRMFLQRFYIVHAKIRGLGNTRKTVLRSYGLETAADVDARRIEGIKGFGPSIAGSIVAWRRSLERQFVFNPNQQINPGDISIVKAAIASKRIDLEKKLRTVLGELESRSNAVSIPRNSLKSAAEQAWKAKGQAEVDYANLASTYYPTPLRLAALAGVVVASVVVQNAVSSNMPDAPRSSHVPLRPNSNPNSQSTNRGTIFDKTAQTRQGPQFPPTGRDEVFDSPNSTGAATAGESKSQSSSHSASASINETPTTSRAAQVRPQGAPEAPPLPRPQIPNVPGLRGTGMSLDWQYFNLGSMFDKAEQAALAPQPQPPVRDTVVDRAQPASTRTAAQSSSDKQPEAASQAAQSRPATEAQPQSVPGTPSSIATMGPASDTASILTERASQLNREIILEVQSRLRELGFLNSYLPGVWDPNSRKALREFKLTNHLTNSDVWDLATEQALRAPSPMRADQSFIGGWSVVPGCVAADAPLSVNLYGAKSDSGLCNFQTVTPAGRGWNVQARCSGIGRGSWTANIRLDVSGNQLIWSSERGRSTYFRCQA
jgi:DNA-binding helix-hairpin-helix protein with protein kinase domain